MIFMTTLQSMLDSVMGPRRAEPPPGQAFRLAVLHEIKHDLGHAAESLRYAAAMLAANTVVCHGQRMSRPEFMAMLGHAAVEFHARVHGVRACFGDAGLQALLELPPAGGLYQAALEFGNAPESGRMAAWNNLVAAALGV